MPQYSLFETRSLKAPSTKQALFSQKSWKREIQRMLTRRTRKSIKNIDQKMMIDGEPKRLDTRKSHALYNAAQNRHTKALENLLSEGTCGNDRSIDGYTPLHAACKNNWEAGVRILLEHKANTDIIGPDGLTAAHIAAHHGFCSILKLLMQHNANVDVDIPSSGFTCLILASRSGHIDILKLLLQGRVDVNAEDRKGNTALHHAVQKEDYGICEALVMAGADCLTMNADGFTALNIAQRVANCRILNLLYASSADMRLRLSMEKATAVMDNNVEKILQERPDIALVILKNRVRYAKFHRLGCVLEA